MTVEILTKKDLLLFKMELLDEIGKLLEKPNPTQKKWLRTKEVLEMLKISPGTLQNYRMNGTIKYTRFGKSIYYSLEEIEKVMQSQQIAPPKVSN